MQFRPSQVYLWYLSIKLLKESKKNTITNKLGHILNINKTECNDKKKFTTTIVSRHFTL